MITDLGKQYICLNFGDANFCCINTGLSWYYSLGGSNYNESGGTAQIVSRLASGLIDSLTMTNPARGTFTQAELNNVNGQAVTLQDAQIITQHDTPAEDQWCFVPCTAHTDQATCEYYGCYWYNGGCHDTQPSCDMLNNPSDCSVYGCYWWNQSCHSNMPTGEEINNQTDCSTYGYYWYNGGCHTNLPICEELLAEAECFAYGCYWYRNACHGVDQPELCYWLDQSGAPNIAITDVFTLIDSYIFTTPPAGWSFIPNIENVMGVIDYYLGFDGDLKTGCDYF